MGTFANRRLTTVLAVGTTVVVTTVNLVLVATAVLPAAG